MSTVTLKLKGLNCMNCAGKIENSVNKMADVDEANLNFMNQEIQVKYQNLTKENVLSEVKKIVKTYEPDVVVSEKPEHQHHDHSHEDHHGHSHGSAEGFALDGNMKVKLGRYAIGFIIYVVAIMGNFNAWNVVVPFAVSVNTVLFFVAYLLFGVDIVLIALKNIAHGKVFDENFLMSISTIGAFAIGEFAEAVAVMLFYQIGEFLQDLAVDRSRRSIKGLMDIKPEYAHIVDNDKITTVDPLDVQVGDIILVKPGEKIPLDGIIIEGKSQIDVSSLLGESVPRVVDAGDEILSGAINILGVLKIKTTKDYKNSTVVKIMDMIENASAQKAPAEKFISKFARYYTPAVVFGAIALACIPPIFTPAADFTVWFSRALVFLVASCPCALVVSVPLTFFSGIGAASKNGILIKGGNYLEMLGHANTVVFDRTGTLTKGIFEVTEIKPFGMIMRDELLTKAYQIEKLSNHPIAKSIVRAYGSEDHGDQKHTLTDFVEVAGKGLSAKFDSVEVLAGNEKLMMDHYISYSKFDGMGTVVHLANGGEYMGYIVISDKIKDDSKRAVVQLKEAGMERIVMLTGDRRENADKVAANVGITDVYAELLPNEKVEQLQKLYDKNSNCKAIFVGDGINDAPVLARADVGIAMGGVGSDAAIEAADVVIMTDEPSKIPMAIIIARNTYRIVKQNVGFALFIKFLVLALAVFGFANMWMAVFADVGVTLLLVLNSMKKKI